MYITPCSVLSLGRAGKHLPCKTKSRGMYCCDTAPAPTPSAPISAPDGAAPLGELQPPEGAFATTAGGNSGSDGSGGSGGWFGGWFGGSKPEQVLLVLLPLYTISWPPLRHAPAAAHQGVVLRHCCAGRHAAPNLCCVSHDVSRYICSQWCYHMMQPVAVEAVDLSEPQR